MPPDTVGTALALLRRRLAAAGIETAALDARLLVMHALGLDHAALVAGPERPLSPSEAAAIEHMAQRRVARETVSRITGTREFYGRPFIVTGDTLDPRADTETLVEAAIAACRGRPPPRLLDLGTGTGVIALTLLLELPSATAVAADRSRAALAVAQRNALALGVADRLTLICSDWFAAIDGRFDLIVSNPPYIPSAAIAGLSAEVRLGDPAPALDGGPDGLAAYRAIAAGAAAHLNPGGLVLVEIGEGQDVDVERVFGVHGFRSPARGPARIADLAGRVRVLGFSLAAGR